MDQSARVLFVDDDPYISDIVKNTLETEGYQVSLASNGKTAVDFLNNDQADLVLLDIKLPDINGLDILKDIRQKSQVPVIMLTGVRETESLAKSFELGADDYVQKPFRTGELIARIRAKLRRPN